MFDRLQKALGLKVQCPHCRTIFNITPASRVQTWDKRRPYTPPAKPQVKPPQVVTKPTSSTPTPEPYSPPARIEVSTKQEPMMFVLNPDGVTQWIPESMFASLTGYTEETNKYRARTCLTKLSDQQLAQYGWIRTTVLFQGQNLSPQN